MKDNNIKKDFKSIKEDIKLNLYLYILALKKEKEPSLTNGKVDSRLVFIFDNKQNYYDFLIDNGVDLTKPEIKDIADNILIMRKFENGKIIIHKNLCLYYINQLQNRGMIKGPKIKTQKISL